jgi:hypothetical protein
LWAEVDGRPSYGEILDSINVVLAAVLITELLISREITRKSGSAGHYEGKDIHESASGCPGISGPGE